MIKALWFITKLVVIVGAVIWVAERPGSIRLDWIDLEGNAFVVNMEIGLFLAALIVLILLSIFIYSVIKGFADFPKSLANYNAIKANEKGYAALTKGLSAVAAGDTKAASKFAKKARKFLPEDTGLPMLLQAQAARLEGRESDAAESFVALLEDKNASFLGVRGLLQAALDSADYETAYRLVNKALASYPKQEWILKVALDIQIRLQKWEEARSALKTLKSIAAASENYNEDQASLWIAEAREAREKSLDIRAEELLKQAQKAAPHFAPAGLELAQIYIDTDRRKKALKLIEKQLKATPHDIYIDLWDTLMDEDTRAEPLKRLRWFERAIKLAPNQPQALFMAGKAALDAGLWGEAREYLAKAGEAEPRAVFYETLADIENRSNQGEQAAAHWLSMAVNAQGEKRWVCSQTGQAFETWKPVIQPGHHLNSLIWRDPAVRVLSEDLKMLEATLEVNENILEAPNSDAA